MTTPLLRALRKALPDVRISYVAEEAYAAILENHPNVDQVIELSGGKRTAASKRRGVGPQLGLIKRLRSESFDASIDLLGNPRSAILLWLTGARCRVGFDYRVRRCLYNMIVERDHRPKSAIEFHLDALKPLGIPRAGTETELYTTEEEDAWAMDYLRGLGATSHQRVIGIHPGASWPAKRWLPERFAELANRIIRERVGQVVFTTGPGEEQLLARIMARCERPYQAEVLPVRKLLALLRQMDVYVSNDCGVMHMAAAVGTPIVGIFGPNEPEIWFPYDPTRGHQLVHKEVSCSRCYRDFCDSMDCMYAIGTDDVYHATLKALAWQD